VLQQAQEPAKVSGLQRIVKTLRCARNDNRYSV